MPASCSVEMYLLEERESSAQAEIRDVPRMWKRGKVESPSRSCNGILLARNRRIWCVHMAFGARGTRPRIGVLERRQDEVRCGGLVVGEVGFLKSTAKLTNFGEDRCELGGLLGGNFEVKS